MSLPVAYLCDGPRIPEDIRRARIDDVLELVTRGFAYGDGRPEERNVA
jgi:flagellar biosynthesis GTPase FlhF